MEIYKLKRFFVTVMLFFLYRGLRACRQFDTAVAHELECLPEGLIIILGIENQECGVGFICEKEELHRIWTEPENLTAKKLEIKFKSVSSAIRLVLGLERIEEAYAKHQIIVGGEIRHAMILVRCIKRVENYIFPKFITKRLFVKPIKKTVSSFRIYWEMFF